MNSKAEDTATAEVNPADGASSSVDVMEEFRAGVTATLRSWSALRAAVESAWGGAESRAKAEDLRTNIYQVMDGTCFPPKIELWDLEDNLAIYMEEEFSVVLEDDSEKQVAGMLWRMYEGCYQGDVSLARQAIESAKQVDAASVAFPVRVENSEQDDSEDEDSAMDTTESEELPKSAAAQEYAAESLFGSPSKAPSATSTPIRQLGEAIPEEPQVKMDEDGFAPVQTKRRNRK